MNPAADISAALAGLQTVLGGTEEQAQKLKEQMAEFKALSEAAAKKLRDVEATAEGQAGSAHPISPPPRDLAGLGSIERREREQERRNAETKPEPAQFELQPDELDTYEAPILLKDLVRVLRHPVVTTLLEPAQRDALIYALVDDARAETLRKDLARSLDHATPQELDAMKTALVEIRRHGK